MRKRKAHMDKTHDDEYKREMKRLYKKISAKNRAMMNHVLVRQKNDRRVLLDQINDMSGMDKLQKEKEVKDVLKMLDEQHQAELSEETFRLKLEQDEEAEKLRKEFAVRKRMGLKELQQDMLKDVGDQGNLAKQQVDWLLKEHKKNQNALEKMYDEEISRQRMVLEEKLARKKALAQAAESQEDNNTDLLNTSAGHKMAILQRMKKQGSITGEEASRLLEQARKEMMEIKDRLDIERKRQETELHKKLSLRKRERLEGLERKQAAELSEYDKKTTSMQTDGPLDPMAYAEGRLKVMSQHRLERSNLENEIDEQNADELEKLRSDLSVQTQTELKGVEDRLIASLPKSGDATLDKLLRQHEKELSNLKASQEKNKELQKRHLQERLAQNKEEWHQRKEAEKTEQQQLREYEDRVVSKLISSQVTISDEERERIMKEHEKQMVKLENSLTLNKLRQKRMIEEKIAEKRALQMEKLQQKQHKDVEKQKRMLEHNAEESDEEGQQARVDLMKKHIEQKMAVLQGQRLDWDQELEGIRIEMIKERSLALKAQEERLGALVAGLQLSKAKEMAKIEEQQKAIFNLKTNLMDDLNERGVLSDPECQAVIQRHHQEQEQLRRRLDTQRQEQERRLYRHLKKRKKVKERDQRRYNKWELEQEEELLRQRLHLKLEQREKSMIAQQDSELKNLVAPNRTAAKIKKMLLIHKHMVGMEQLRNSLEREISQALEEVRRQYEVDKMKQLQMKELEFVSGLVRVGKFQRNELHAVLQMLYPNKSDNDINEIMAQLYDPTMDVKGKDQQDLDSSTSSLVARFQNSLRESARRPSSSLSIGRGETPSFEMSRKKKKKGRESTMSDMYEPPQFPPPRGMPPPIMEQNGDVLEAQYHDDYEDAYLQGSQQYPPSKLPPLESSTHGKKKKKKKFLKKKATPRDYDDEYDDELL